MIRILVPQIIGFLAVATFLLSYQQKKRKQIILLNVTSRVLYILQYVLLGAYAGAVLDILGAFSSVLAGKKHTPFMRKYLRIILPAVTAVMVAAGVTIAILNRSYLDLFSLVGVLLHTSAFWMDRERAIRVVSLLGSPFWFVYNLMSRAYGSALGDILTMGSILIAMFRYRNKA
ncbi:MAG: YgjV family protein [Clostridia bacterium]|nr:YgjV family protein [Clostridia bacterium]